METVTPQEALEMVRTGGAYGIDVRETDEMRDILKGSPLIH